MKSESDGFMVRLGAKEAEHVNATHTNGFERDDVFLNLVDFKWLMAGVGWWVSLSRLQSDRAYIDECLQRALRSGSQLLRERSIELLGLESSSDATTCCDAMPVLDGRWVHGGSAQP